MKKLFDQKLQSAVPTAFHRNEKPFPHFPLVFYLKYSLAENFHRHDVVAFSAVDDKTNCFSLIPEQSSYAEKKTEN